MSTLFLCLAKSLDDQIEYLNKAGRKGKNAVSMCYEIIDTIRADGLSGKLLCCKRTRNGEARFDKCVKYDLGNGYRMITIRHKDHLFIPFLGTHDKVDLWLEHNRLDEIHTKKWLFNVEKLSQGQPDSEDCATEHEICASVDEYEEGLLGRLDDKTLRDVFRGLVEQR